MNKPLPDVIREYLTSAPVCRIATVRPSGEPHVIPVCPVYDGAETLYFDLGPRSATAAALRSERRTAVLFDDYHDDWTKLRKVLLRCVGEPMKGEEQEAAWDLIRRKFPQHVTVAWHPRLTMALRIQDWLQEGFRVS